MNKAYRLIWNELTHAWVVVSELAKSRGKRASGTLVLAALGIVAVTAVLPAPAFAADPAPTALPTGGQIASGVASIGQSGANMVINQSSDKLITNWQSFNIGKDASVTFNQPSASSAALNRVSSQDPTQILGRLSANGQVMIVNPAGVVFGKGSQVNVGALTASTLNISDADFLAGKHHFAGDGSGQVLNQGKITTPSGGRVVFIAPVVSNEGEIRTPQGTTALAAGSAVDMDINGDGSVVVRVTQGAINALAENKHLIQADEGTVILTAHAFDALTRAAVKNSGVIEAKGLSRKGGRLILAGGPNTDVTNTGTLDVSSVNHAGGTIDISGAKVDLGGTANASGTTGGSISVSASETLAVTGTLDVRGSAGAGGTIQLTAAQTLNIAPASTTASPAPRLDASGTTDGGQIAVTAGSEAHIEGELIAAADANTGGEILLNAQHITLSQATLDVSGGAQGGRIALKAATPAAGWLDPANPINDPTAPPDTPQHVAVLSGSALRSNSRSGRGGRVTIEGENILLASGSTIEATGESGGGEVLVGGDWQGGANEEFRVFDDPNTLHQATTVTMEAGASIDVSAIKLGAGGTAVLWSDIYNTDSLTTVKGTIHAFGGAEGGDGGQIETSGHNVDFAGASVSAAAPQGNGGLWLIDPDYNNAATIQADADTYVASLNTGTSVRVIVTGAELKLEVGVVINKTAGGDATLTLKSQGVVLLQDNSRITSSSGKLNVVLWSDSDGGGGGAIRFDGRNTISTNGGHLYMGGGSDSKSWNGLTVPSGNALNAGIYDKGVSIRDTDISTGSGNIEIHGQTSFASKSGVDIETGSTIGTTSGSITITGISATGSGISTLTGTNTIGGSSTTGAIELVANTISLATSTSINTSGTLTVRPSTASGTMAIGTGTGTLSLPSTYFSSYFHTRISEITLGGSTTTGNVDVDSISLNSDLQIWTSGTWAGAGTLTTNGNKVTLNTSNTLWTVGQIVAGTSGDLTKEGTGTVKLSGANTYTGATTVSGGTLQLGASNRLSPSTAVSVSSSATFDLANFSQTVNSITGAAGSRITLGSGTLTVGQQNIVSISNFSGVISGSGNLINASLSAEMTLSGNNTYTGTTTIDGQLTLNSTGNISSSSSVIIYDDFILNGGAHVIDSITGDGRIFLKNSSTLTIGDASNSDSTSFTGRFVSGNDNVGDGNLVKAGTGTLVLSNNNFSWKGPITVNAGTLQVTNAEGLGTTEGGTTVTSGATLDLRAVNIGAEAITLNGGTLANSSGTSSLSGAVTLGANSFIDVDGTSLTLSGAMGDIGTFGFTKTGNGILTLNVNNSYDGVTNINAGTLQVLTSNGLGSTAGGTTVATNASLELINAAIGAEAISLNSSAILKSTGSGTSSLAGVVSGSGVVEKTGNGTFTLSGNNSYSGSTTVSVGKLIATHNNSLGNSTGATNISTGATLELSGITTAERLGIWEGTLATTSGSGNSTLSGSLGPSRESVSINVATGTQLTLSGAMGNDIPAPIVTKIGGGTAVLSGNSTLFTGAVVVNAGTLQVTHANALGTTAGSTTVASGATLDLQNVAIGAEPITLNGGTLGNSSGTSSLVGPVTLGANSEINVAGTSLTLSGVIADGSNSYGITKTGTGTAVLAAANTYDGATSVNAGTLKVTNAGGLGSITNGTTVADGASLELSSALVGAETLSLNGTGFGAAGALINSGTSSLTGLLTVNTTAKVLGGGSLTLGSISILDGQTLTINGSPLSTALDITTGAISGIAGNANSNLTINANSINLGSIDTDIFQTSISGSALTLGTISTGRLLLGVNTSLSQTGAVTVSDTTILSGGAAVDMALTDAGNDFVGGVAVQGGQNVTLNDSNDLILGNSTANINISGNLIATAAGSITQANNVIASGLAVKNASTVSLQSSTNNAATFAAENVGTLSYVDSNGLDIGTVNPSGISASGPVLIETLTGDLTLSQNISTTDTSTSAVILNAGKSAAAGTATGGNIVVSGSPTITLGSGGRATLMSGSVSDSTGLTDFVGSGSGRFRYNSDEVTTNYTAALGSGNYAIYREQALISVVANNDSKIYDKVAYSGNTGYVAPTGMLNGDTDTILSGTVSIGGNSQGAVNAGTYNLTPSGLSNTLGYGFNYVNGTLTIAKKSLTPDTTNVSKVYDGTTLLPLILLTGAISGDEVTLVGSGAFLAANAGSNISYNYFVDVEGTQLGGGSAANYLVNWTGIPKNVSGNKYDISGSNGIILAKTVSLGASKTYDGDTLLGVGQVNIITGVIGESLTYTGATASNAHVAGPDGDITTADNFISAITLADGTGSASNYALPTLNNIFAPVTITAAQLTPTLSNTNVTKVYDGDTSSSLTPTYTFSGLVSNDTAATLGYTGIAYNSKDVAAADRVTVSGLSISSIAGTNGSAASDYVLDASSKDVVATITAKTVGLGASKTYDGTTTLSGAQVIINTGVSTESLTYSGATASSAHVAGPDGNIATADNFISAITLADGSGLSSNYALPTLDSIFAPVAISAATLTPTLSNTGVTKTYDGDTSSSLTPSYTFTGLVTNDTAATLGHTGIAYNSKDVLTANTVTVSGLSISSITGTNGSAASDYVLDSTSKNVAATITAKTVGLVASKTYDGNTTLGAGQLTITTGVGTETLAYSGATASDAHVTTASKYINAITLVDGTNGGVVSNYALPTLNNVFAPVTITARTVGLGASKTYDGTTTLSGAHVTVTTGIGTETLTYSDATASNAHVAGPDDDVTTADNFISAITLLDGTGVASDYALPTLNATFAPVMITAKQLAATASITAAAKTYDGLLAATGSSLVSDLTGELNGDSIDLDTSGITLAFSDAHVATANKTISATGNAALGTLTAGGGGCKGWHHRQRGGRRTERLRSGSTAQHRRCNRQHQPTAGYRKRRQQEQV